VLTEDLPRSDHDPWVPMMADPWLTFLEGNPAAFHSVDVLDDLGAALNLLRESGLFWSTDALVEGLGRRCAGILDRALTDVPAGSHLPWAMPQNRAALRMESRLGMALISTRREADAFEQEMRLLRLNPGDNHGVRASVMNRLLSAGRDEEAVALAERYPDDAIVEVAYGSVLALYRLGRHADALAALETARNMSPKVVDYLVRGRVRKPSLDGHYLRHGGDDEAWYYREHMREIWVAVPGLLAWLKQPVTAKR
jgi:tetratricopeptide (TPR) repeat protein